MRNERESRCDSLEFWKNTIPELDWRHGSADEVIFGVNIMTKHCWVSIFSGKHSRYVTALGSLYSDMREEMASVDLSRFFPKGRHTLNKINIKRLSDWISHANMILMKRKKREKMEELESEATL